jgi:hypothetical protein
MGSPDRSRGKYQTSQGAAFCISGYITQDSRSASSTTNLNLRASFHPRLAVL